MHACCYQRANLDVRAPIHALLAVSLLLKVVDHILVAARGKSAIFARELRLLVFINVVFIVRLVDDVMAQLANVCPDPTRTSRSETCFEDRVSFVTTEVVCWKVEMGLEKLVTIEALEKPTVMNLVHVVLVIRNRNSHLADVALDDSPAE